MNGIYDPHNPPMTMANVRKFTDKWNQLKVRGMECTREQMLKDQKLELAYIAGNLYGNLKQREYIERRIVKSRLKNIQLI